MRIGLVGPYPPPRGGVSVHLQRLESILCNNGVKVEVFDTKLLQTNKSKIKKKLFHLKWLRQFEKCNWIDILHIHTVNWLDCAVIISIAKRRKIHTIITFHSLRDEWHEMTMFKKKLVGYVLKNADYLIATGEKERNKLLKWLDCRTKLSIIPAFLKPKEISCELPTRIAQFIQNHKFIISANGSNTNFYQGNDIYGLDMLVELCSKLSNEIDVGFIYCLSNVTDIEYIREIQKRIATNEIEDSFLIVLDNIDFWPLLRNTNLFIRPACTDSFGVSVAEALSSGIPSIASDVCKRPEGTILFKNRSNEDLYAKTKEVINNFTYYKECTKHLEVADYGNSIYKLYQKFL
ncbi:glycosyltransferase family 4 protein [Dehalobacter sp. TBBPA1]|uniref:glycosyltransferase family 4 protein n=1 Tax=Dehalobacter sp. TBBPA1 TaxID=3235037 RepID=UPI0034A37F8D